MKVILWSFWGRRPNVDLQLPFIRRILAENPQVEFQGWNLARDQNDSIYLRTIAEDRITVNSNLWCRTPIRRFNTVWQHYAQPQYEDFIFVKIDDDIVFVETDRFRQFVDAVAAGNGDMVFSAQVINNGACTPLIPQLWSGFEELGIPLLDVHLNCAYGDMSHNYLFDHWRELVGQPVELVPTEDWLSINLVGYDWHTGCRIAERVGRRPHPRHIAGRDWDPRIRLGDEGAANMLPRTIMKGFVAGHLSFGPQHFTEDQLSLFRKRYGEIAQQYLERR